MAKKKTKRKTKTSRARAKKAPAMEMLLVSSKTKAAIKAHGVNVASDAIANLNGMVYWYIEQAANRAQANGRKTVRAHDFVVM